MEHGMRVVMITVADPNVASGGERRTKVMASVKKWVSAWGEAGEILTKVRLKYSFFVSIFYQMDALTEEYCYNCCSRGNKTQLNYY